MITGIVLVMVTVQVRESGNTPVEGAFVRFTLTNP